LFVGMTSTFYILRNAEGEVCGKNLATLFVVQVGNFSIFNARNLITICHPVTEFFYCSYNLDNSFICEEFTSETGASNIKPMGWLVRTWFVVVENISQQKSLMTLASLILNFTFFQPSRRAHQVLEDFDVFPRIWTLFCYTLY